ncbi:divalent-cation tolerance protein CutA [Thermodesulfobacteriota bacterium]
MTDYIQIFTTTDKKENAHNIAREVIDKRLAACTQIIGPVTSTFRWKDNIVEEEEWLLIMKTRSDLYKELENTIKGIHTYEVPEILALPVVNANQDYLDWLDREVKSISPR